MICPERSGCFLLGDLDIPGWLQEAVEAASCRRGLGKEQIHAIELTHVTNPVGFENGFSPRHRQGMESAYRTLSILLQIVEVRGLVPVGNGVKNAKVQFERLFHLIEHAPNTSGVHVARHFFDFAIAEQKDVEFWTDLL